MVWVVYLDEKKQFFIRILSYLIQSAEGAWEITIPYGLCNDGLKPVTCIAFEIILTRQDLHTGVARPRLHELCSTVPMSTDGL